MTIKCQEIRIKVTLTRKMAVPKKKKSKSRSRMRRNAHAALCKLQIIISADGDLSLPHRISKQGIYNGKRIFINSTKKIKNQD